MALPDRFADDELPLLAGFAGAALVRTVIKEAYESRTGHAPPEDPNDDDTTWADAITWTLALAAGAAFGRLVAKWGAGQAVAKARTRRQQQKFG